MTLQRVCRQRKAALERVAQGNSVLVYNWVHCSSVSFQRKTYCEIYSNGNIASAANRFMFLIITGELRDAHACENRCRNNNGGNLWNDHLLHRDNEGRMMHARAYAGKDGLSAFIHRKVSNHRQYSTP
jgi:hypothetical protein